MVARDAEIVKLLHKGVLYREIAKRFGISGARVFQIARKNGVPQRFSSPVPMTQDERVTIIRLARNGLHVSGIGDVVNRAHRTIMSILTEAGIVPYNGQDIFGTNARSQAIRLVASGMTYGEAAEKVGMTRSAVAGACNRAGIKVPEKEKADRHARGCAVARVTRRETWMATPVANRKAWGQRMVTARRAKAQLEDA